MADPNEASDHDDDLYDDLEVNLAEQDVNELNQTNEHPGDTIVNTADKQPNTELNQPNSTGYEEFKNDSTLQHVETDYNTNGQPSFPLPPNATFHTGISRSDQTEPNTQSTPHKGASRWGAGINSQSDIPPNTVDSSENQPQNGPNGIPVHMHPQQYPPAYMDPTNRYGPGNEMHEQYRPHPSSTENMPYSTGASSQQIHDEFGRRVMPGRVHSQHHEPSIDKHQSGERRESGERRDVNDLRPRGGRFRGALVPHWAEKESQNVPDTHSYRDREDSHRYREDASRDRSNSRERGSRHDSRPQFHSPNFHGPPRRGPRENSFGADRASPRRHIRDRETSRSPSFDRRGDRYGRRRGFDRGPRDMPPMARGPPPRGMHRGPPSRDMPSRDMARGPPMRDMPPDMARGPPMRDMPSRDMAPEMARGPPMRDMPLDMARGPASRDMPPDMARGPPPRGMHRGPPRRDVPPDMVRGPRGPGRGPPRGPFGPPRADMPRGPYGSHPEMGRWPGPPRGPHGPEELPRGPAGPRFMPPRMHPPRMEQPPYGAIESDKYNHSVHGPPGQMQTGQDGLEGSGKRSRPTEEENQTSKRPRGKDEHNQVDTGAVDGAERTLVYSGKEMQVVLKFVGSQDQTPSLPSPMIVRARADLDKKQLWWPKRGTRAYMSLEPATTDDRENYKFCVKDLMKRHRAAVIDAGDDKHVWHLLPPIPELVGVGAIPKQCKNKLFGVYGERRKG